MSSSSACSNAIHVCWSSRAHALTVKSDCDMMSRARVTLRPQLSGGMFTPRMRQSPNANSSLRSSADSRGVIRIWRRSLSLGLSRTYSAIDDLTECTYMSFISTNMSSTISLRSSSGIAGNASMLVIAHALSIHSCWIGAREASSTFSTKFSYRACDSASTSEKGWISSSSRSGMTRRREKCMLSVAGSPSCSPGCPLWKLASKCPCAECLEGLFRGLFGMGEEKAEPPIFSLSAVLVRFIAAGER
mmetsp:Transcript_11117/g.26144  ORF Transcript_11117/g.26144 Transcript_11117/m.26144 type:complete len:246 (+) Transcript_11117:272-1009(+)